MLLPVIQYSTSIYIYITRHMIALQIIWISTSPWSVDIRSNIMKYSGYISSTGTCLSADAANWAQASGKLQQNIVIPYIPSPARPHWTARYGAAAVVVRNNTNEKGYVFLMGGDSYNGALGSYQALTGDIDTKWYNGFKNDIWSMSGTDWIVKGDIRLRTKYGSKIPQIRSTLEWVRESPGLFPPLRMSYDTWVLCEQYFNQSKYLLAREATCQGSDSRSVQWSPRRHHAAVVFKGYIYVLGGRARELIDYSEYHSVGGIKYPRVQDPFSPKAKYSTQREASVLKNDVWRSIDGRTWTLVTPGCKQPQASLVSIQATKKGASSAACTTDDNCYGNESCMDGTCVCQMWSAREQHSVAVDGEYIYVSGGYASQLYSGISACGDYACGDTDASSYRAIMSDVWRSSDGLAWTLLVSDVFERRGGHQMLIFSNKLGINTLYIFGGRGGDNSGLGTVFFYNDTWSVSVSNITDSEKWVHYYNNWSPRTGHTAVYEEASITNSFLRRVYVLSGSGTNGTVDDVWIWRPDIDEPQGKYMSWIQDYSSDSFYSMGKNESLVYYNNSPTVDYVYPDGNVSLMQRFFVPSRFKDYSVGLNLETRPYLTNEKISMLNSVGIFTIRDLATADLYTILKLRGYDYPQVPKSRRLTFTDICDVRALAIAIVDKCDVNENRYIYDGQQQMPWNVRPVFGGPIPDTTPALWHGRTDYNFLRGKYSGSDVESLTESWDGCTYVSAIQGVYGPNVPGIGFVRQVKEIENPTRIVNELVCRQTPGSRVYHSSMIYEGRLYTLGGRTDDASVYADTWYRDDNLPIAKFTKVPKSRSSDHEFRFVSADGEPVSFEYRVWEPYKYKELRGWSPVTKKADVSWLNWREGGPSNGFYRLYVRAIDPAGNKDLYFYYGVTGNVYNWKYLSPTAWDIILIVICSIVGLLVLGFLEYQRRIRKAAIERYAMKRLRRKFKALQRDEEEGQLFDWRALYFESKTEDPFKNKNKQQKKIVRDKRKERREKMKKRREQEKERIKRSLQGGNGQADKSRVYVDGDASVTNTTKTGRRRSSQEFRHLDDIVEEDAEKGSGSNTGSNSGSNENKKQETKLAKLEYDEDDQITQIERRNPRRYRPFDTSNGDGRSLLDYSSYQQSDADSLTTYTTNTRAKKYIQMNETDQRYEGDSIYTRGLSERGLGLPWNQSNVGEDFLGMDSNSLYPTEADYEMEIKSGSKKRRTNQRLANYYSDDDNDDESSDDDGPKKDV